MPAAGQEDSGPVLCALCVHSVASHVLLSSPGSDDNSDSNAGWKNKAFSDCSLKPFLTFCDNIQCCLLGQNTTFNFQGNLVSDFCDNLFVGPLFSVAGATASSDESYVTIKMDSLTHQYTIGTPVNPSQLSINPGARCQSPGANMNCWHSLAAMGTVDERGVCEMGFHFQAAGRGFLFLAAGGVFTFRLQMGFSFSGCRWVFSLSGCSWVFHFQAAGGFFLFLAAVFFFSFWLQVDFFLFQAGGGVWDVGGHY